MTGYISQALEKKMNARQFSELCLRMFGACVMMRDDSMDAVIPERFEPSDCHAKKIAEYQREIEQITLMTDEEFRLYTLGGRVPRIASLRESKQKAFIQEGYLKGLAISIGAWVPSEETRDAHDAILDQVTESIRMETGQEWYDEQMDKLENGPLPTKATTFAKLYTDIVYHEEQQRKEVERTEERNQWLATIRAELNEVFGPMEQVK